MSRREHDAGRSLLRDTSGATYVEFIIAFIPLFIMFLGMLQAALLYTGNLVVTHAANTAARAAIVVLPDDPAEYDDEEINTVNFGTSSSSGDDALSTLVRQLGMPSGFTSSGSRGSPRLNAIRSAASIPLLAVSPSFDQLVGDEEVYKAVGGPPATRAGTGAALYNRTAVAVSFPETPGSTTYHDPTFGPDEDITVRVTYLFHCGVPIASRFMCDDYMSLSTGIPREQLTELARAVATNDTIVITEAMRRVRHASERLDSSQPGKNELNLAQTPWLAWLTILTGARFSILRAETTLRNHGANYSY